MIQEKIIQAAKRTLEIESLAIGKLIDSVDEEFVRCIEFILKSKGRMVVTGIGKSAIIANKIVATLNSTGTPSLFMHAADAIHGDLGIIQENDIVLCLSKSGNTPEIKVLVPFIKQAGNAVIGMSANKDSFLSQHADFLIHTPVEVEACPNNLAPTTSTTAQLAMGDAVAVALIECRGFKAEDFARFHPGGALGKRLYLKIEDCLLDNNKPQVSFDSSIREVIIEMTGKRLGSTAVIENNRLVGIITDGDLRRMLQQHEDTQNIVAKDIMSNNPKTIDQKELAIHAFEIMESKNITQIIVMDGDEYKGIVHLHDLLREGIF